MTLPDKTVTNELQHAALRFVRVVGRRRRQPQHHADPHDRPHRRDRRLGLAPGCSTTSRRTTTTSTARCPPTVARPGRTVGADRRSDRQRRSAPGPRRPGTCRPTPARTSSSASAYATDGGVHFEGPFLDDIAVTVGGTTVDRRRRGRRQRLDRRRRLHASSPARPREVVKDTTTWPRTAPTAGTTTPSRPGRTTSASATPSPTGWSGSRTRTACWSWYVNGEYTTTTPPPTPVAARSLPGRRPARAGRLRRRRRCSATVASRSTRRSARRPPTR